MKVVFHEDFYQVYTWDPAADAGRMESIVDVIEPHVEFVTPRPASPPQIEAVHSHSHIDHVRQRGLYEIASLAAGGAIKAASIGLTEPCFGLIRPPGHHASSASAWGFCYFNNMAIAIEDLKRTGAIRTAYILDIDLHYGDGTVAILQSRDYVTIHNVSSYDRHAYMDDVHRQLSRCHADVIAVSAGFDAHEADWGGTLKTEDYRDIGRAVKAAAGQARAGCFALLEGGYNQRVLGHNVLALIEGLGGETPQAAVSNRRG